MQAWRVHGSANPRTSSPSRRSRHRAQPPVRSSSGCSPRRQLPRRADLPRPVPGQAAAAVHPGDRAVRRGHRSWATASPGGRSATGSSATRSLPDRRRSPSMALMEAGGTFPRRRAWTTPRRRRCYIGYQTGWFGLHRRAHLQPGETLLVHAARRGRRQRGRPARQGRRGARSSASSAGRPRPRSARALGADVVVDRHAEDFVARRQGGHRRPRAPTSSTTRSAATPTTSPTKCIAFEGRILVIGFAGGTIQTPRLNHALVKNYSIVGLHWGLYTREGPRARPPLPRRADPLAAEGAVEPLVSERLGRDAVPDGAAAARRRRPPSAAWSSYPDRGG